MANPDTPSFSTARRWGMGLNVVLRIAVLLALVAMVNYLAVRHFKRWPVMALNQTELSPRTIQVLRSLTNEVKVTVYFDSDDDLFPRITSLLREYQYASPLVQVQVVDYIRDAATARVIKSRYKLAELNDRNMVIFESGGRTAQVSGSELSDYDIDDLVGQRSQEVRRTHFKGEIMFTSRIYAVSNLRSPKAYFLTGHGEHSPTNSNEQVGYSKFGAVLRDENNVQIDSLSLLGGAVVPSDCNLLIIAGPTYVIPQLELDQVSKYLEQGGRLLVAFNYESLGKRLGLEKILSGWNVSVGDNVVLDTENSPTHTGKDITPATLGSHPIVRPLLAQNSRLHLVLARTIQKAQSGAPRADDPKVEELLLTGPRSVVVTEFQRGEPVPMERDKRGAAPLMAVVEKGKIPGVNLERGSTRMVVLGDSIFWGNHMIDSAANRDFAAYTVNWLLGQNVLLSEIPNRPIARFKLTMTPQQMRSVRWILLLGMPGTVLVIGTLVWLRRRS